MRRSSRRAFRQQACLSSWPIRREVRAFAKALRKRAKTDPIDAAVIAHFVEAAKPDIRPMPDEQTRLLADLVARRAQIVQMIVAERQRQKRKMVL
jgi:transposase